MDKSKTKLAKRSAPTISTYATVIVPTMSPSLAMEVASKVTDANLVLVDNTENGDIYRLDLADTLWQGKNLGYPGGCNLAARHALRLHSVEKLVFMNDDVILGNDWLKPLVDSTKKGVLCGAKLIEDNYATEVDGWILPYLEGFLWSIHVSDWKVFGPLDERMGFGYFEEALLCARAMRDGASLRQVDVPVIHLGGQTSRMVFREYSVLASHLNQNRALYQQEVRELGLENFMQRRKAMAKFRGFGL